MRIEEARALAAQCWCEPETSSIEMDTRLAEAFAEKLVEISTAYRNIKGFVSLEEMKRPYD